MKRVTFVVLASFLTLFTAATSAIAPSKPIVPSTFTPIIYDSIQTYAPPKIQKVNPLLIPPTPTPEPTPKPTPRPTPIKVLTASGGWHHDTNVSWYGPGFYGNRTACGLAYTTTILGVAHKTLPCGTLVEFRYKGKSAIVPVIDRGPYVAGRQWDLSGGLCVYLDHCFTGAIEWRLVK